MCERAREGGAASFGCAREWVDRASRVTVTRQVGYVGCELSAHSCSMTAARCAIACGVAPPCTDGRTPGIWPHQSACTTQQRVLMHSHAMIRFSVEQVFLLPDSGFSARVTRGEQTAPPAERQKRRPVRRAFGRSWRRPSHIVPHRNPWQTCREKSVVASATSKQPEIITCSC